MNEKGEQVNNQRTVITPTGFWGVLQWNPFRVFFILGILYGVVGVGYWVMGSVGWVIPNLAATHAAVQTQGFLASFVVGFLMTAFPRFTGTWPVSKIELGLAFFSSLVFFSTVTTHNWIWAEAAFFMMISTLVIFAARRVPHRKKDLPPSFLLMGFGFLHALLGTLLILMTRFGTENYPLFATGRQMVQVGFLLCMVLGITGKLAPFLMGYTDNPEKAADGDGETSQRNLILLHGATGALIFLSFFLEPFYYRIAWGLRALVATIHLLLFAQIGRPLRKKTSVILFFFISCWMIPVGLWTGFFLPALRIASLHIVFLGGFSLMIFSFGLLIVLSHSGKAQRLNEKLFLLRVIGISVLVAMVLRFAADIWTPNFDLLIHLSSGTWVLAALFWGGYILPLTMSSPNPRH